MNEFKFEDLYRELAKHVAVSKVSDLTLLLQDIGINPLDYMNNVPDGYMNSLNITQINIPNRVEEIGEFAFSENDLNYVKLPSNLKRIGGYAFSACDIESLDVPEGVIYIDNCAFSYCENLKSVSLPHSLDRLGGWVFQACNALEEVNYNGTKKEWGELMRRSRNVFQPFPDYKGIIYCIDGNSNILK